MHKGNVGLPGLDGPIGIDIQGPQGLKGIKQILFYKIRFLIIKDSCSYNFIF